MKSIRAGASSSKKNGEQAFLARYINSDYTGRVEFLYIDPEEIH